MHSDWTAEGMAKATMTMIDNDTIRPSVWNAFSKLHTLKVKFLDGGAYQIIITKDKLYFWREDGNQDIPLYDGEALSVDSTDKDTYVVLADGKVNKLHLETMSLQPSFPDLTVTQVACGSEHALFLNSHQQVYSLGKGPQVGLGKVNTVKTPQLISQLENVLSVHAGARHSVAVVKSRSDWNAYTAKIAPVKKRRSSVLLLPTRFIRHPNCSVKIRTQISGTSGDNQQPFHGRDEKYTDKLLKISRLNAPEVCCVVAPRTDDESIKPFLKELDNHVMVWGCADQHQLGLNDAVDKAEPTLLPKVSQVATIACGSSHTSAMTANGELLVWGKLFQSNDSKMKDIFPTPTTVETENDLQVIQVTCGDRITIATVYKKDVDCPHVAVVHQTDKGLKLQLREINFSDQFLQNVACTRKRDKGAAIYQRSPDMENGIKRKLHWFSSQMINSMNKLNEIQTSFSIKNEKQLEDPSSPTKTTSIPSILGGFIRLIGKVRLIFRYSATVVDWIVTRSVRLPYTEVIENQLVKVMDEYRQNAEDYILALNYFQQFSGFSIIEKSKDIESAVNFSIKKGLEELFVNAVPRLDVLHLLVKQLCMIDQNNAELKKLDEMTEESNNRIKDAEKSMKELKDIFSQYHKTVLDHLYQIGGRYLLISGERSERTASINIDQKLNPNDPKMSLKKPIIRAKLEGSTVILTDKALVFLRKINNKEYELTEWKLYSIWLKTVVEEEGFESSNTLELMFPETKVYLTSTNAEDFERWKIALENAIYDTFCDDPLRQRNIDEWDRRKFSHIFLFGPKEGCRFSGEWKNGEFEGYGELSSRKDKVLVTYIGEFQGGYRNGFGTCHIYHENEEISKYIEETYGWWKDDQLDGFGMSQTHYMARNSRTPANEPAVEKWQQSPLFKGHFKAGMKNGFGVCDVDDEIYLGNWKDDVRFGDALVISFSDGATCNLIDCRFENDSLKEVKGVVSGHNFFFKGNLNDQRLPDGQGTLTYNITPKDVVEINGIIKMQPDGTLIVKEGRVTPRRLRTDSADHVFRDIMGSIHPNRTRWNNLVVQCLSSLSPKHSPAEMNEKERSVWTWKEVMSKVLPDLFEKQDSDGNEWSVQETVNYFVSLTEEKELSSDSLAKMEKFIQKLYDLKYFPINIFMEIRTSVLSIPVGLAIGDATRLQELVVKDLNELLVELFIILRHLFPALPEDIKANINSEDSIGNQTGFDFAYACLPSNVYAVLADIFNHPCQNLDRRFREELNKSSVAAIFLDQLQIPNTKLLNILREEEKKGSESNSMNPFAECVNEMRRTIPDELEIQSAKEAFKKIFELERVCQLLEKFLLSAVGTKEVGADDFLPLLSYLIWKAKPSRFSFWLSYIEKLTSHRITNQQQYLMQSFYAAYTACCSSASASTT